MKEIEQKLVVSKEDLEKVFNALAPQDFKRKHYPRAYFDTLDMKLNERKVALRIQIMAKGFQQTIKAAMDNEGDSLVRAEWDFEIDAHAPNKAVIDNAETLKAVEGINFDQLVHIFTSDVKRRYFDLAVDGGMVELAFDLGRIYLPNSDIDEELCEIEVELKSGDPHIIGATAKRIQSIAPSAKLSMRSKAERGFDLYMKHRL